jgi:hypothetical protein
VVKKLTESKFLLVISTTENSGELVEPKYKARTLLSAITYSNSDMEFNSLVPGKSFYSIQVIIPSSSLPPVKSIISPFMKNLRVGYPLTPY